MNLELSEKLQQVIDSLTDEFSDEIRDVYQSSGDSFIRIAKDSIIEIARTLKEKHRFVYLADILGTDRFTSHERFEVIYNLVNLRDRERIFIKVRLDEENPNVESLTSVWKSANWFERQTYDMYGVIFNNHPDMRRIYMPEDFEYYPLRKEFPLLGIPGSIELPSSTPDTE